MNKGITQLFVFFSMGLLLSGCGIQQEYTREISGPEKEMITVIQKIIEEGVNEVTSVGIPGVVEDEIKINKLDVPLGDDQWTLLQAASYRGYIDAIKLLIDNGADLNYPSFTPLMLAIIRGGRGENQIATIKILIDNGANPNSITESLVTPLIVAMDTGGVGVDAVKLLLEAGADVNRYAPESLLTKAVKKGDKDIIRLLLEYGIDVNVKDLGGGSPLIAAVEQGDADIVKILLNNGADPNTIKSGMLDGMFLADGQKIDSSRTVLMMAVEQGDADIVKILLNNGADPNVELENGTTVFDIIDGAQGEISPTIVQILSYYK